MEILSLPAQRKTVSVSISEMRMESVKFTKGLWCFLSLDLITFCFPFRQKGIACEEVI